MVLCWWCCVGDVVLMMLCWWRVVLMVCCVSVVFMMLCWWCLCWWCCVVLVLCGVGVVLMVMCWWWCVEHVVWMVLCWWRRRRTRRRRRREEKEEAGWSKKNKNPTWQCGEIAGAHACSYPLSFGSVQVLKGVCPNYLDVSQNGGTPKSSSLVFLHWKHPSMLGYRPYGNPAVTPLRVATHLSKFATWTTNWGMHHFYDTLKNFTYYWWTYCTYVCV